MLFHLKSVVFGFMYIKSKRLVVIDKPFRTVVLHSASLTTLDVMYSTTKYVL